MKQLGVYVFYEIVKFVCEVIRFYEFWVEKCLDDEKLLLKRWLMVWKHKIRKKSIRKWWVVVAERRKLWVLVREDQEIEGRKWKVGKQLGWETFMD